MLNLLWRVIALTLLLYGVWWLLWRPRPPHPFADQPWSTNRNVYDCQNDTTLQPIDPNLTASQRARLLELLKQACHPETK